jgi:DNA-binding transcriptional MerR regulator
MSEYFMPISELAKKLDIPAHTLRYWEKEFPSLIQPATGAGGRRYYRENTVTNITALKKYLYADGYTIDGVKKLIANGEFSASGTTDKTPDVIYQERTIVIEDIVDNSVDDRDIDAVIDLLKQAKKILDA